MVMLVMFAAAVWLCLHAQIVLIRSSFLALCASTMDKQATWLNSFFSVCLYDRESARGRLF